MEELQQNPLSQNNFKKVPGITPLLNTIHPFILGQTRMNRLKRLFEMAPAYACLDLFDAAVCDLREKIFAVGFDNARKKAEEAALLRIDHPMALEHYPIQGLVDLAYASGILIQTHWENLCRCRGIVQSMGLQDCDCKIGEDDAFFLCKTCVETLLIREAAPSGVLDHEKRDPTPISWASSLGKNRDERWASSTADTVLEHKTGECEANLLESILDAMQEMIVYYDGELNVIWANRAAAEFAGLNREEMFGKNFYSVACQQEEPCEGCPVVRGLSSDYVEAIDNNLFIGRLFFTRSLPVFCGNKKLPGRLLVAQDISGLRNRFGVTDILNDISEIFHSPKRLPEMCEEVVKTIVSKFDFPAGYITLYDETAQEIVNLGEIDLTGKLLPLPKRLPPFRSFSAKVMEDGFPLNVTGLSKMADFSGYALKEAGAETVLAVPLNVETNTIGAIVLVDLVERLETDLMIDGFQAVANRLGAEINKKQTEEKLREERNFTMAVLNSAGPFILILDTEGRIVRFNKAGEKLTGYAFEEAAGRPIWDFFQDPKESGFIRKMFPLKGETTAGSSFENWVIAKDGKRRLVSWSNSIMGDPKDKKVHVVCIGVDITDKRKAEEEAELRRRQLLDADKMASLGMLASGVAHEINNPNNFIMMNAPILRAVWEDVSPILNEYYAKCGDFMLANIPFSEMCGEVPKLFDGIEDGSRRIRQIILNMKNYTRRDALDMGQEVHVNDAIIAALGLLSHLIKKSTQSVLNFNPKRLPPVRGNQQRLEQVVVNLVQNACQALPDRKKKIFIVASLDEEKNEVVVCVADEGVGIRPEHMAQIFDPFFTTKLETGGTGLGLSVCLSIVKEHNGRLEFTSETGKGTRAYLSLPVIR